MSRLDLLKKYNYDYSLVDDHIIKRKRALNLYKVDPKCPEREDLWLYYAMDHEEIIDSQSVEIEQGMRVEANLEPSAAADLVSPKTCMFADTAPPSRAGHNASSWKEAMPDLLPGTEPAFQAPPKPGPLVVPKSHPPVPSVASG